MESSGVHNRRMKAYNRLVVLFACIVAFTGCATLQGDDPVQVTVAGIEPLQGEGMELRLTVKLRVQNPNDTPIDYRGVAVTMDVQGKTFASGVSDSSGTVPRFGEAVIAVPVSISAFRMVRQAMDLANHDGRIAYEMKGKLSGSLFGTKRFATRGELDLSPAQSPTPP
jgi:LEA14-like dessication related protein